jgi:hypothetical protein
MRANVAMGSKQTNLPRFLAGDIILYAGRDDMYSRLSRWLMRTPGEGPTYAVHTAQFLSAHKILEMDFVGRIKTIEDVLNKRYKLDLWERRGFEVWRCQPLTVQQRAALTRQARPYINVRFGSAKFFMYLLDSLASKIVHKEVRFFRSLDPSNRYPVCSGITAIAYDKALHYRFGVAPEYADPDHIHDWVKAHPAEWVQVFRLEEYQQAPIAESRVRRSALLPFFASREVIR